jgi:phosphoglycerate dehydrogenase-like enzyme
MQELALPELDVLAPASPEETRAQVGRANLILGNPPLVRNYINDAKKVVWVQSTYAGIDALNADGLRKDYLLTNIRTVYGPPIAEYVFAYILAFKKEILENLAYQKERVWQQRVAGQIEGETLCVVGAGSIGKEVARIGKAFGMRTLGYRTKDEPVEFFDEIRTGDLKQCVAKGDYVVSILPNTGDTTNVFTADVFAAMKKTGMFINVGRGNAVNEHDVIGAVARKDIACAVLDVFKTEPLPADSPLWSSENILVTPHMSGYIVSDKEFEIFAENYRRFCAGEELMFTVDFSKGY